MTFIETGDVSFVPFMLAVAAGLVVMAVVAILLAAFVKHMADSERALILVGIVGIGAAVGVALTATDARGLAEKRDVAVAAQVAETYGLIVDASEFDYPRSEPEAGVSYGDALAQPISGGAPVTVSLAWDGKQMLLHQDGTLYPTLAEKAEG